MPLRLRRAEMLGGRHPQPRVAVGPLSSTASDLGARLGARLGGPSPGRGPGPGPGRPRRGSASTASSDMEQFGNATGLHGLHGLGHASRTAEPAEPVEHSSQSGAEQAAGRLGVAEQLLIAWRHILTAGTNASADIVDVDMGLLSLNASLPGNNASAGLNGLAGLAGLAVNNLSLSAEAAAGNESAADVGGLGLGGYMELGNASSLWSEHEELMHIIQMVTVAVLLGLVILATVIGNVFVIAAILLERHLQNVANYLILSLAVADLLVACLVMPLGAVYEVSQQWTLGPELCDMWTSSDVLCCTASILHLVAIALDRYWAVTNIDYIHQRTARRIGLMILVVWLVAFMVCIAPMLGWKDPGWDERVRLDQECMVSQDIAYQVFATASSFYLPLLVILGLYWRIYQAARRRIRRRVQASGPAVGGRSVPGCSVAGRNPSQGGVVAGAAGGSGGLAAAVVGMIGRPLPTISETTTTTTTTAFTNVSSNNTSPEKTSFANGLEADPPTADQLSCSPYSASQHHHYPKRKKEAMDSKRERKAAKTLAIITGAFVMCWLPFFIMAILQPVCDTCYFNKFLVSFFLWLGYFNSTLNPIIYTIFSPEFRHAFKRLLCGRRATLRRRNNRHLAARGRPL